MNYFHDALSNVVNTSHHLLRALPPVRCFAAAVQFKVFVIELWSLQVAPARIPIGSIRMRA